MSNFCRLSVSVRGRFVIPVTTVGARVTGGKSANYGRIVILKS